MDIILQTVIIQMEYCKTQIYYLNANDTFQMTQLHQMLLPLVSIIWKILFVFKVVRYNKVENNARQNQTIFDRYRK